MLRRPPPTFDPGPGAMYRMLFCDEPELFAPQQGRPAAPWQATLYGPRPDPAAVQALARDSSAESRVRALAWAWLRDNGYQVPARQLLGVVFEVPMAGGLDVLAAYADGSVRLLHHAGPPALFQGPVAGLQEAVMQVLHHADAIVQRIGPTDAPRRAPPTNTVRMSFIVSDGLYFGEGPLATMERDGLAGPLLAAGAALLGRVTALSRR